MMFTEEELEILANPLLRKPTFVSSEEEYLEGEAIAKIKSEYNNGKVTLVFYSSINHSTIVSNLADSLYTLIDYNSDDNYQIYLLNLLVYLPESKRYFYPDVSIVYGKSKISRKSKKGLDALLNPQTIIEVSLESTEGYDLGEKMRCYLKMKSVKQYVVVSTREKSIITYTKNKKGEIRTKIYEEEDKTVQIGKCKISMEDIYRQVGFEKEENQDQKNETEEQKS